MNMKSEPFENPSDIGVTEPAESDDSFGEDFLPEDIDKPVSGIDSIREAYELLIEWRHSTLVDTLLAEDLEEACGLLAEVLTANGIEVPEP
jgi:hypothetical protein